MRQINDGHMQTTEFIDPLSKQNWKAHIEFFGSDIIPGGTCKLIIDLDDMDFDQACAQAYKRAYEKRAESVQLVNSEGLYVWVRLCQYHLKLIYDTLIQRQGPTIIGFPKVD